MFRRPCLATAALLALVCSAPAARAQAGGGKLVVLDAVADDIDGSGFVETLEAYVSDVGVTVDLTECADPPADHDGWVRLATETGRAHRAKAVLWFEPHEGGDEVAYDIYLVLLEQRTGAVVVLPVELGLRRGAKMFRVLAATTRMVLDTEILDDIQEVIEVSKEDPPPDPWPAPPPEEPAPEAPSAARTVDLSLGYVGDLGFPGATLLNGGRLGVVFRFLPWLGLGLDAGLLASGSKVVSDIEIRVRRVPIRLALSGFLGLGPTEGQLAAFWSLEPVWIDAGELDVGGEPEEFGRMARLDSGGGGELRWRFPLGAIVSGYLAVSGQGMVVSHTYRRTGQTGVRGADFRLGWSAGFELTGL